MKRMGFRQLVLGEVISGVLHSLHVYEVRGFTLNESALAPQEGNISGIAYSLAVGSSVNEVCRRLVGDDFTDDEAAWQKEHNCTPPYLIIYFGPTHEYRGCGNLVKDDEQTITTYESFSEARMELRAWEHCVLAPLLTALACGFETHDKPVKFLPTDRAVFGLSVDGRTIDDIAFFGSASGYGSTHLDAAQIQERLASARTIAANMNPKVARFSHLALLEDDTLKKFLYWFLAIEIQTHATFAAINHAENMSKLVVAPPRAAVTTQSFFDGQRQRWTTLKDRFVWCVLCVWTHLSDSDVDEFRRLKGIRDQIAHGSITVPSAESVVAAQRLATKLLLPPS